MKVTAGGSTVSILAFSRTQRAAASQATCAFDFGRSRLRLPGAVLTEARPRRKNYNSDQDSSGVYAR